MATSKTTFCNNGVVNCYYIPNKTPQRDSGISHQDTKAKDDGRLMDYRVFVLFSAGCINEGLIQGLWTHQKVFEHLELELLLLRQMQKHRMCKTK